MTDDLTTDAAKKSSVGRIGSPEEVADAALFLASNQFANGTTLTLDGGLSYH
jgi:3-oxoacyl-[acyl-carrier protein] reductase